MTATDQAMMIRGVISRAFPAVLAAMMQVMPKNTRDVAPDLAATAL